MRLARSQTVEENSEIDMTPMIDIIFQLIIFFLMFSSFVDEEPAMKTELPVASQTEAISLDNTVLITIPVYDINDTPTYFITGPEIGDKPIPHKMGELRPLLDQWWKKHQSNQVAPKVLVVMDKHAYYEAYIYVRNLMLELHITRFFCKVKKEE
ncbi:MAG TPA: biopolymer transporter ExbD [Planctomycetota bacterium]|nr:biopolymer transporter ExbD [Planctomycetota bacterium]